MRTIREPGKFEGEPIIAPVLYELALSGYADDEAGSIPEYGYYAWRFDLATWADLSELLDRIHEAGIELTAREAEELADCAGILVTENDQGFVSVELLPEDELEDRWNEIMEELAMHDGLPY